MSELLFKAGAFEGPLDLLVYMVKSKRVDVREIPISVLTDEFLDYMRQMKELDIQLSSEFMATASYLMYLKSKALLPKIEGEEKEKFEKEREKLYEIIEMYSKVKSVVESIEKSGKRTRYPVRVDRVFGAVDKLVSETLKAVIRSVEIRKKVYKVKGEDMPIEVVIDRVMRMDFPKALREIVEEASNRYELVITILAILELIKMGRLFYEDGRLFKVEREGIG